MEELSPALVAIVLEYVNGAELHLMAESTHGPDHFRAGLASFFATGMEVGAAFGLRYPEAARVMFPPPPAEGGHLAELEDSLLRLAGVPVGRA